VGSASSNSTSARRSLRRSKSKIPPEHGGARFDVFEEIEEWIYLQHV
jgi:hypothetical protein